MLSSRGTGCTPHGGVVRAESIPGTVMCDVLLRRAEHIVIEKAERVTGSRFWWGNYLEGNLQLTAPPKPSYVWPKQDSQTKKNFPIAVALSNTTTANNNLFLIFGSTCTLSL